MFSQQDCEQLLTEHGIKPTANRIVVVKALAAAERPMSLTELEYKILSIDKSGVFRALVTMDMTTMMTSTYISTASVVTARFVFPTFQYRLSNSL